MPRPLAAALLALVVIGLGLLVLRPERSAAQPEGGTRAIAFLYLTGEGPSAKVWYRGAPPTGEPVQDALDAFAAQGYRVASVTGNERPSLVALDGQGNVVDSVTAAEQAFVILLERE